MSKLQRIKDEIQSIWDTVDAEDRPTTPGERAKVNRLVQEAESEHLKARVKAFDRFMGGDDLRGAGGLDMGFTEGPGDAFIKSEGWKSISDPSHRGQSWTTGAVDVGFSMTTGGMKAGTLLEGAGGQGAGFVSVPSVVPGVVTKLFEQPRVSDAFSQTTTDSPTVRYMIEGTATSAAAGVAEGGTKPASDIAVSTVDEPVKKIATVLTISDEMAEDAPSIQAYLNSRLGLFVAIEEDRQLLRGAGTNELVGLVGRSGVNTYTRLGTDDNATSLARVLANTAGSANLYPDTIILHPQQWLTTRLLRDGTGGTAGQFLGGGPFTGAYGNGGAADSGLFGMSLWNTRVVVSSVVGPGTAIVGNFTQAAQIHRRGGRTVEISNSHASYFQQDLLMLRCEQREALAVYRPAAFTVVSGMA
jgi:HK97 family phage major capsid protein